MKNVTRFVKTSWLLILCGVLATACTCLPKGQADLDVGMKERGIASWYGEDFHGWVTASGEIFDMESLSGAHRTLPLGTVVRVTNVENGKQVRVRINDRGPYVSGRILDLSYAAARKLGMAEGGLSAVSLEVVGEHGFSVSLDEHKELGVLGNRIEQGRLGAGYDVRKTRSVPLYPGDVMLGRRERRVGNLTSEKRRV
ncbi:MAG: septal ring lytic transglycosylase RlpA family protein [Nitrospiraceae bacterium]